MSEDHSAGLNERRLHRSEQRYRSLFERNRNAVCLLGRTGLVVDVNAGFEQLTSHDLAELQVTNFLCRSAPESAEISVLSFKRALAGEAATYQMVGLRKAGERVDINITNVPIVVDGSIVGVYGIVRDMPAR